MPENFSLMAKAASFLHGVQSLKTCIVSSRKRNHCTTYLFVTSFLGRTLGVISERFNSEGS